MKADNNNIATLQIFPGLEPKERLIKRFSGMSNFSYGTVIAMSEEDCVFNAGNYKIVFVSQLEGRGIATSLKLLRVLISEARKLNTNRGIDLVVAYDPLKIGLFGLLIKWIFNAKLLIEVNSELNAPALFNFKAGLSSKIKKFTYPKIKKFVLSFADGVKGLYRGQLDGVKLDKNVTVDHFFDYTPVELGQYEDNEIKKVVSLGFPAYIKGYDFLIEAFNELSEQFPEWQLEIIGHFNRREIGAMNAQIAGNSKINVMKPIHFSEVPAKIDSCSILVLASRSEGMGRVLIESMGRGRARIASSVGGIPTVLENGIDGHLFESENVEELKHKLSLLMESEPERKRIAENGLKRFSREFTLATYIEKTEALYMGIVKR